MRILQICTWFEVGGTEAFVLNHLRNIDRTRFHFDFLLFHCSSTPYEQELKGLGANIIYADLYPSIARPIPFIKAIKRLIQENGPYDIVHAHCNLANSFILYAAKLAGVPVRISHSHNTGALGTNPIMKPFRKLQQQLLFHSATKLLACGEAAGKDLYGTKEFTIIHNGIDVEKFTTQYDTTELRKELNIQEDSTVYGNITRFDEQKNMPFVVDIFNEILKQKPNSILLLGGQDGPLKQIVIGKINQYNIKGKVRILGERKDIPQLFQLIDAYIFPSLYEGLPFMLLEAQAAGMHAFISDTIPPEVDLQLGTIHVIPLQHTPQEWATKILNTGIKTEPSFKEVTSILTTLGYNIRVSANQLESIYNKI